MIVFGGRDAAGKGSTIKAISGRLNLITPLPDQMPCKRQPYKTANPPGRAMKPADDDSTMVNGRVIPERA